MDIEDLLKKLLDEEVDELKDCEEKLRMVHTWHDKGLPCPQFFVYVHDMFSQINLATMADNHALYVEAAKLRVRNYELYFEIEKKCHKLTSTEDKVLMKLGHQQAVLLLDLLHSLSLSHAYNRLIEWAREAEQS